MKRLILTIALCAQDACATPAEDQAAAWLDKAEMIDTVYSENITKDSVLALLLLRMPSKLPRSTGYYGAGLEDHAVLMLHKNGKPNYVDSFLLQSCLSPLTLETEFPNDLKKSVKFDGPGRGISFKWLNGPDDKRHMLSVSNKHFLLQTLPEDGDKPGSCKATSKAALRKQLLKSPAPNDAWNLTELLLCGAKTPGNVAYLRDHTPKKNTTKSNDTGSEEQVSTVTVNATLLESLLGAGEASDAEMRVSGDEVVLHYWPNEACVNGRTLRYNKGQWRIVAIDDACD